MDAIVDAEREVLKLRLFATLAALTSLVLRQPETLRRIEETLLFVGLTLLYLAYTLSLRSLLLPRVKSVSVVYVMIVVDTAFLLAATHWAGGLRSNLFVLFPVIIVFYAIHLNYRTSFFAAIVTSFTLAGYGLLADFKGLSTSPVLTIQIPLHFLLAYFSGYLAHRATEEKGKPQDVQQFIRIERGASGLRDVVRVFNRTLELYEEWMASYITSTSEKESVAKLQFSLSVDAQYALTHYAFAKIYSQSGQLNRAEEALRRSILLDPNLLDAYRDLSQVLLRAGRFEEALEPAKRYAQATENDWVAHQNLAVIYHELRMADMRDASQDRALAVSTGEDREALLAFFERLRGERLAS